MNKKYTLPILLYLLLISYLLLNTGIISDDYEVMSRIKGKKFAETLHPGEISYFIDTPIEYFTHYIWYYFFRIDNSVVDSIVKILYIFLSFYLISKFFQIFLDRTSSFLISFLFIFFPSHDSTAYCFMAQYLTLSFAFYLYAFYLAHQNKLFWAFILAFIASFISYGSTPIALALSFLFFWDKEVKKAGVMIIPNIIYILYFIPINIISSLGSSRIIEHFSIYATIKQFILQALSFIDAMIGPSMWLKIYYAFPQLSVSSIIIGIILTIILFSKSQKYENRYNLKLILCFTILTLFSFLMFAVTGRYPQIAFNLGNRVTIYGSLLLSYLIVLLPVSKKIKAAVFTLMLFVILGISDHWKSWNLHQQKVIANIQNNYALKNYDQKRTLYVSGNQYSKYGPISHIEFLSEGWVVNPILALTLDKEIAAAPLNKRYEFIDGYLIDKKYNWKEKVNDYINIYDSEQNRLFKLETKEINRYINSLPDDYRHWVEICNNKLINDLLIKLMPRIKYAL